MRAEGVSAQQQTIQGSKDLDRTRFIDIGIGSFKTRSTGFRLEMTKEVSGFNVMSARYVDSSG